MYVSQRRERSHVSVLSRSFCSLSLSFPLSLSLTHARPVGVRLSHFWWTRLYTRLIACRDRSKTELIEVVDYERFVRATAALESSGLINNCTAVMLKYHPSE